jgi:hypothetical protein
MRSLFRSLAAIVIGLLSLPAPSLAQQSAWTASAGRYSFDFRDVSRHRRPVDASPISWKGGGASLHIRHERATLRRSHRFDASYASARDFSYRSPLRTITAANSDRASALTASYEYRRYMANDLGVRGFDIGLGGTAGGGRASLERAFVSGLADRDRRSRIALGAVVAARLRRWPRVQLETWWTNGMALAHRRIDHTAEPLSARAAWGGGFYDEWWASGRVRLTTTTSLVLEHALAREYFTGSHAANAAAWRSLLIGVAYGR